MVLHKIKGICSFKIRFYETKALIEIFILRSCVNISWALGLTCKMFDKSWKLYILVERRLTRQDFSPLYIVYFISVLLIEIANGNFECLTWTSPLLIVGWCLHLCSEIQNQSPYPNHDSQAWCAFCQILFVHTPWCTRYTCSANTQSVQLSVRRFTRHQVLVSMTTNTIDFTLRIFKSNNNIFFNFGNSPRTRPNYFGFARYWWSSSCSLLSCWKKGERKAVPWERRLDNQPLFGKWPHASLPKGRN